MNVITKQDIVRKLTSRKFWVAVASFITNLMIFFGSTSDTIVRVGALIMAGASVIAYIIGEGLADSGDSYVVGGVEDIPGVKIE